MDRAELILAFFARNGTVVVADTEDNSSDTLTFADKIIDHEQVTTVTLVSDAFDPPSPAESEEYSARNPFAQKNATYTIRSPAETPEPSTLFLLGSGLLGITAWRRLVSRAGRDYSAATAIWLTGGRHSLR
jgi:hypothetical protein